GYTNMFAADNGSVDPKYPVNTGIGAFIAQHGGTVLGSYGYSISPSSTQASIGTAQSFQLAHGTVGVLDTSVPFGGVDFTSDALIAKQKNVNSVVGNLDGNSNIALVTALRQAGVNLKVAVFPTGYAPDLISSPAWPSVQGVYFQSLFRPFSLPNSGTEQMAAALMKYQNFKPGQFPVFSQYESWLGADLMIKGLELAGPNPTRSAVISDLRGVTDYNGGGLLPYSLDYSTIFGHNPPQLCLWYLQAEPSAFVPISPKPFCGTDVRGTSTST
ncbi:MAG TPA: ABC transporter substrate-binding protein, partial [Acidimicrobiales bacterium]|nr:ABC transporter substrate-binding protein [Acidimicrobiales bacterium]